MKFSDNLAKALFVLSLVVFVLLYGVAAGNYGWFPRGFLDQALDQARNLDVYYALPFTEKDNWAISHTSPQVYESEGAHVNIPSKVQPGMTLITSLWDWDESGDLEVGAKLINKKGRALHSWQVNRDKLFSNLVNWNRANPKKVDIMGSHLSPNGDLLLTFDYVGTARLDACGKVLWELPEFTHHSVHKAEDGSFWISATSKEKRTKSEHYPDGFPGLGEKAVWLDRLLHVTEDGNIIDDINVLDVLYMNGLERYIPKTQGGQFPTPKEVQTDITHLNDVEPLSPSMADEYPLFNAGDLVVSLRALQLVFVFDPETLEVKWHASEPFIYQHDPDFIGDGWIGVFDNNYDLTERGKMLGGSRIVALEPHTGKQEILFPTEHSDPFYTDTKGSWQILDNGNLFLTEANAGRIVEVTPDGQTVWEWIHEPVGDSRVPIVQGSHYDLSKEDVASWPCSSVNTSDNTQQEGG